MGGVVLSAESGLRMHRITVTSAGAKNYLRAAKVFDDAACAKRDLAAKIHVELARQKTRWARPWPDSLRDALREINRTAKACIEWRDAEGEIWLLLNLPVMPIGASGWCEFGGVSQREFKLATDNFGAFADPLLLEIPTDGWRRIAERLWEHVTPLELLAELFRQLAVTKPADARRGTQATRDLLEAAAKVGVDEEKLKKVMLERHPDAVCRVLKAKPSNMRDRLTRHFNSVKRDMMGRKRPSRYRRKT
jgi:hypothetical protein